MKLKEVQREVEWRKCRSDIVYFLRNYGHVIDQGEIVPFEPFDYQLELLAEIEKCRKTRRRHLLILKGRQIGFSAIMGGVFAHRCLFFDHQKCYVGSKRKEEAEKILEDMNSQILLNLPDWMTDRAAKMVTNSLSVKRWENGSEMKAFPADEPARGYTPTILFLDEWAFSKNPEKAWRAAYNAVEHGGILVAGSSANGHGTMFHNQWLRAESGLSKFVPLFYGWQVHPRRGPDFIEQARMDANSEWELQQEHPTEAHEAFAQSGRWVFNPAVLDEQKILPGIQHSISMSGHLLVDKMGPLRVFEPPEPGRYYVIGADVAQGVAGGDYTCAQVLRDDGKQVAVWHGHSDVDLFAAELDLLGRIYNDALVGCESNTPGDGVNRWLRRCGYPRLYRRRDHEKRWEEPEEKLGWHSNKQTKPLAVNTAVKDMREGSLRCHDAETVRELRGFVAVGEGAAMKMEGKPHDDRVDAWCIAAKMREFAETDPDWAPPPPPPPAGSHAWWMEVDEFCANSKRELVTAGGSRHMRMGPR